MIGELGAGGMGQVLRVRDEELGRELAAKVLHDDAEAGGAELARFVQEARITGQLQHPQIVPLHELGRTAEGRLYFTMKNVEGQTLAALIRAERPVAVRPQKLLRWLDIFLKVCDAVAFAHSRGVIHRDIKPENIMAGAFGEVLVCDWGLAALRSDDPAMTPAGTVLGTPAYMPPEQAAGRIDEVNERSDVYALGAVLYEMLALARPFDGDDPLELLRQVTAGALVPPRERAPEREIPWELERVVLRAMHVDPAARYPNVGLLRADIEAYLEGRLLASVRYSRGQRTLRWLRRHGRGLAAAGLVLAALAGTAIAIRQHRSAQQARAERGRAEARAREQERRRILERRLAPLEATLRDARIRCYVPRIDIAPHVARVRAALTRLGELAADPELAALPELWLAAGRGLLFLDDLSGAERALRRALPHPAADLPLARIHLRQALRAALDHDRPRSERLLQQAAHHLERVEAGETESSLIPIYRLLAGGRTAEAVALARRELASRPDAPGSERYHYVIAFGNLTHDRDASNEETIRACTRALERRPHGLGRALRLRGHARYHQGDHAGAIEDYGRAIALDPRDARGLTFRGLAHQARGDLARAINDYTRATQIDPGHAPTWFNRGNAHLARGDLAEAIDDYSRAIRADPRYAGAYTNRGNAHQARGDLDTAIADYTRAIALDPRSVGAYSNRGVARKARGDRLAAGGRRDAAAVEWAGAVADYTRAIALDPRNAGAWTNRGNARQSRGDLEGAIADHGRAIALDPRNAGARTNRALSRQLRAERLAAGGQREASQAELDAAIADCKQATALQPERWQHWTCLALCLGDRGHRDEALDALQRARERAPASSKRRLDALLERIRGR